jgi:two-component system, NarL family, sensor histidine kinase UhpB
MRTRTLLTQVLAVNSLLVGLTAVVAVGITRDQLGNPTSGEGLLLLALAVFSAVLLNSLLIRRRLEPMERLVQTMDQVDLSAPGMRASPPRWAAREVQKLTTGFNRMLSRIEDERRQAGRAVLRGQEQERSRIAQDLHDEVNQALTGILLRLEATTMDAPLALRPELQETKRLANQAMEELLQLARQLRPTALDDHGLIPALASQVEDFSQRTGIDARFARHGDLPSLTDEEQLVIYRVTQESLSNIAQHADASHVRVQLSFVGRTILRISDDGAGFDPGPGSDARNNRPRGRPGGLGLTGMRERALLVGGNLALFSAPNEGTTIELTMGAT